jgi:chaperonin GroEL (HSP60 family)
LSWPPEAADQIGASGASGSILGVALAATFQQIQKNSGNSHDIPDNIKDLTSVVRCALENAVSVATILIMTETIIADKTRTLA